MSRPHLALVLLSALALTLRAENSAQLEEEADRAFERNAFDEAQRLYRSAGERRLKECALYETKKRDDFDLASDEEDELSLPGAGATLGTKEADQRADNFIRAAYDFEKGASPRQCDDCVRKAAAVTGVSKKTQESLAALRAFVASSRDPAEREPPPPKKREPFRKLGELLSEVRRLESAKASEGARARAWNAVGEEALLRHRADALREAADALAALKQKPKGRWFAALASYERMRDFPGADEVQTPKTLADLGVAEKRTLVAGELDWNAEDATACVEEALASGATTVVFERHETPWYVRCLRPRSNQRLVFRKGVRIYMDRVSCQNGDTGPMVRLEGVENVILEGEGQPGDVVIAKFPDRASRAKWQPREGGSGFGISGSRRIVIRNLTSCWNSCDGVGIGGREGAPSSDIWLENVVLSNNYRQGMSVCDCVGLTCRKVSFLDTFGGEPMCGVDFEQNEDVEATSDCRFYDCTFGGNVGGAVNWSAGGYFPVTAHLRRCRFLSAPTPSQISVQARDWSSRMDDMRAPGKIVFEDCEMEVNTGSNPFVIRNSNAYDIDILNFRLRDLGPRKPGANETAWHALRFDLRQDYRCWGREPRFDFQRNEGRVRVRGLVVEGFGERFKPVGVNDENGGYSVTNVSVEATINGKAWNLPDWCYNAPESGWGIVPKFDPGDYLPPLATAADTPDELPVSFRFNWRGAWWEPPPEYRALSFEKGAWKMTLVRDGVRALGLERLPVAYYCRSNQSRFKLKGGPCTVYFEVPAKAGACRLKVQGNAVLKNAKGETVGETQRWKNRYLTWDALSAASEVWSLTFKSSDATLWMYPPLAGIVAERPDFLPRRRQRGEGEK